MDKKEIRVSVVVCAYNEEMFIGQTIRELLRCPAAEEIIVVNDGSTDDTLKILKSFGKKIKLVTYKKNRGKGYAFSRGVRVTRGRTIVLLDAHLKRLKNKHLQQLSQPILKRKSNYVLGLRGKRDPLANLTGERAYLKDILAPHLGYFQKSRFGLETYLNSIFDPKWGRSVHLKGLVHLRKRQKMPLNDIMPAYIQEVIEISKAKAEIQLQKHRQLKKVLQSKEVRSVKALKEKLNKIKDKEISELIEIYVLPYIKKSPSLNNH